MIIKMKINKVIMKVMKITMNRMVTTGNTECICCISLFRHTAGTTKKKHTTQPIPEFFFETRVARQRILPPFPLFAQHIVKAKLKTSSNSNTNSIIPSTSLKIPTFGMPCFRFTRERGIPVGVSKARNKRSPKSTAWMVVHRIVAFAPKKSTNVRFAFQAFTAIYIFIYLFIYISLWISLLKYSSVRDAF